ncbi:MAG TPA: hypothetical protein QF555_01480 [Candidatus Thalassarchaeaceae archaeon]|mgnify:CR=1 FL=1|nr:hypothetical protein [Candidatus Thalassarchaeaceae archaeon]
MDGMPQPGNLLHIASEPGAGVTSLALQIIKSSLELDGRIVWIGREMPDPGRLSDILGTIPPTALSRFHAAAFGEHLARGIEQSLDLIEGLDSITHVVIDNWAGFSGRVDKELIQMMSNLIDTCDEKCTLIVTSSMYADASGKDEWAIRGPDIFTKTWRLLRKNANSVTRLLDIGEQVLELMPSDNGFIFTSHSS